MMLIPKSKSNRIQMAQKPSFEGRDSMVFQANDHRP